MGTLSLLAAIDLQTGEAIIKYLATVIERFEFVFTLKYGLWLNLIEGFFSKMIHQMLRGIRVKSKDELKECIYKYFAEINKV